MVRYYGGLRHLIYQSFHHPSPLSPSHPRKGLFPPPLRNLLSHADDLVYQWERHVYLMKRKLWFASTDMEVSSSIFLKHYLPSCYGFISVAVANSLTKKKVKEEMIYLACNSRLQFVFSDISKQELEQLATSSLQPRAKQIKAPLVAAQLATSYLHSDTVQGPAHKMVLPILGWVFPFQLATHTTYNPHSMAYRSS